MSVVKMVDIDLSAKRVLIREDLNVPVKNGEVTSDARIKACLPTIKTALAAGAELTLMSHLGRPDEGSDALKQPQFSLAPVAKRLSELLNIPVDLKTDYLNGYEHVAGHISLLENVRFNQGEKKNTPQLAQQMAKLCDVYVMDAFGTAHRAQASTHGITQFATMACAGPLLVAELDALAMALEQPASPRVAVVGGSKVSTKLTVLNSLSDKMDQLIVGGGIANTFIAAAGYPVGTSLFEESFLAQARQLMKKVDIPLPIDVVVATEFSDKAVAQVRSIDAICDDEMILDIGPETAEKFSKLLQDAGTIIWNGPVGVFEIAQFSSGTKAVSDAIAQSLAFSIAGGGDTLAAIDQFSVNNDISYISTGGGAFLEYVEGKTLPAVAALQARAND